MKYEDACRELKRVGAAKAEGDALLAMNCQILHMKHPGLSPLLLYVGAKKKAIEPKQLLKMDTMDLSDLQFVD